MEIKPLSTTQRWLAIFATIAFASSLALLPWLITASQGARVFSFIIAVIIAVTALTHCGGGNTLPTFLLKTYGTDWKRQLCIRNNQIVRILPQREWYWRFSNPFVGCTFEDLTFMNSSGEIKICPITDNPKVREIIISLTTHIPGDIAGIQKMRDFMSSDQHRGADYIPSLLCDFAEVYSRKLGTLFNPFRQEQQDQLSEWLREFIGDKLEQIGFTFAWASFSFPKQYGK